MTRIDKRAAAKRDLVGHYVYLADQAGLEVAERFLRHAEESFASLSRHPKMGIALKLRPSELTGIRKWPIKGFENFLIFYLPQSKRISIVRILHGSQDWWSLLGLL